MPPSPEERIADLEGKVEEHSRGFDDLRASIGRVDSHVVALDAKVDRFREELAARIDGLDPRFSALGSNIDGLNQRFEGLNQRMERLDQRFEGLNQRFGGLNRRMERLDQRIDVLDQKVDRFRDELDRRMTRQFSWLVGVQITVLVVVLGSLIR